MFARDPNLPRPPTPASRSQATSDVLREPDWGVNVDMCDLVNSNFHRYGKDTVKALRLKLQKKTKPQTQYLALVALEMCMKNCGVMFHAKVIEKACLDETTKCGAARGGDARVKQKTAYEILSGLVGSEMCIRDSVDVDAPVGLPQDIAGGLRARSRSRRARKVRISREQSGAR